MDPLNPISESEPVEPAVKPEVFEEAAVETAPARSARRNLATYIRGPEDNTPQKYGRTYSQLGRLEQDSSAVVRDMSCNEVEEPIIVYDKKG